ncbi:hypothetical protein QTO34_012158 [Cnephaeus nilssonii]|uniref:Uncharacterized protein n=1 Tax=Cnephaeus nilssonii TaxID=3371016 RepID=A0AA40HC64_CNENI|nr:hypothetical protein QTO34_012158 [Eptesicus nilssonii]
MFITVMFGAGCRELVNPWCSLVTLTAHLRRRGRVPPDATIALLAEDGHLVSLGDDLEEGTSQASSSGSPLLQERGTYVLVQIVNGEGGAPTRYESLLENLDDRCPELAGEYHGRGLGAGGGGEVASSSSPDRQGFLGLSEALRCLSGLPPLGNSRRRRTGTRTGTRRGHQDQGPPSGSQRLGSLLSRTR